MAPAVAKQPPPPDDSAPSLSSTPRSPTGELVARAERAAVRASGEKKKPTTEVPTEILDRSQLPVDLDDEAVVARDPRRQLGTEHQKKTEPELPRRTRDVPKQTREVPKDEDAQKAESILQRFLANASTRREEPKPEQPKPPPEPAKPPPPAPSTSGPHLSGPARALAAPLPIPSGKNGALVALNQAQPPGVFFRENQSEGRSGANEDPKLAAAVDEAISILFGVRGIHHVGPGQNEVGEPVVVVAAGLDFGEASLNAVPPSVGEYRTLITLPFDLLPLRRNR